MSQIKLSPNASGTGVFTIDAPNSNTNRTLTLSDSDKDLNYIHETPSTTKVGFRVSNDAVTIVNAATDYTIPYANDSGSATNTGTRFDLGNNFNTTTYKFVVPVTGYYMMTNTTFSTSSADSGRYMRLRLDNQSGQIHEVLNTISNESGDADYNQIIFSGVFLLTAADELYCQIASSVGSSQIAINGGQSVWSGWLLG